MWDKNLVMVKSNMKVGVFDCAKDIQDWICDGEYR